MKIHFTVVILLEKNKFYWRRTILLYIGNTNPVEYTIFVRMKNLTSAVGTPFWFIVRYRLEIKPLIRRMLGPCDSNASKPEVTDLGWGITLIQTQGYCYWKKLSWERNKICPATAALFEEHFRKLILKLTVFRILLTYIFEICKTILLWFQREKLTKDVPLHQMSSNK